MHRGAGISCVGEYPVHGGGRGGVQGIAPYTVHGMTVVGVLQLEYGVNLPFTGIGNIAKISS